MSGEDRADEMRDFLREKWSSRGGRVVNIGRATIEAWGVERGMTADEAISLFESLEGSVWVGVYRDFGNRFRNLWQRVEIHEVR
jgi:hypothetical protein